MNINSVSHILTNINDYIVIGSIYGFDAFNIMLPVNYACVRACVYICVIVRAIRATMIQACTLPDTPGESDQTHTEIHITYI